MPSHPSTPVPRLPRHFPVEALVWTAALVALACTDPHAEGLLDLCVAKWLGLPGCPGCGLGHSIAFLVRGAWLLSWQAHPLGGFAVIVLVHRILVDFRFAIADFRRGYEKGRRSACDTAMLAGALRPSSFDLF